jgi:hypothetical protein
VEKHARRCRVPLLLVSTGRGRTRRGFGVAGWRGRRTLVQMVRWRLIGPSGYLSTHVCHPLQHDDQDTGQATTWCLSREPSVPAERTCYLECFSECMISASEGTSVEYLLELHLPLSSPLTGPGMPVEANMQGRGCAPLAIHQSGSPSDEAAHAQAHCLPPSCRVAASPPPRLSLLPHVASSQQDPGSR